MELTFDMTDDILIAGLSGELDHHSSAETREAIDQTAEVFHSRYLILNLAGVSFMDSAGIGVVMGRYNKMKEKGGSVLVTGCGDYIDRILEMAGIYTIAPKCTSVTEGIEQLKRASMQGGSGQEDQSDQKGRQQ